MKSGARVAGLAALLFAAPLFAQARHVDGLAAIVGGTTPAAGNALILASDVELYARLALAERESAAITLAPITPGLRAAALDQIIGETLIAREAERLDPTPPSVARVGAQREELVRRSGGEEAVARLLGAIGVDASELDVIAMRRARVDAFLRSNLEGGAVVSDARVEEVYASGEHPFTAQPIEEVREPLRALIAAQALERDVARWIRVLRERTTVHVVGGTSS